MLTPDVNFLDRFPEFSELSESRIQLFLNDAVLEISESFFSTYYGKAISLYTAHVLVLAGASSAASGGALGNVSPVASRTEGDVSVSFAVGAPHGTNADQWLNSTPYGQELSRLYTLLGSGGLSI